VKITVEALKKTAPQAKLVVIQGLAAYMTDALVKYNITTKNRVMYFLGQAAHETAGFRTLVEYASGAAYNGRKDLGNTQPGDGPRFKGRGIFQITGRANYRTYGKKLGLDLEGNPVLAADPKVAVLTACEYWADHGLNALADAGDIKAITKRINGGYNGLNDRIIYTNQAKSALPLIFA
jgi:putative chitinase